MFDAQSLTVPVGQEVQSSKEVENTSKDSRKAKIDSFVAKLEKSEGLKSSIMGRKYNYLFNDFGLPTIENQPIFVQLYKNNLGQLKNYQISDGLWENICEDAVEKGVDIQESDKYSLGKDFYSYLYNAAIEDCVKIYEQETLNKVPESDRKVRLSRGSYFYVDPQKFDELLTNIRNKLSDIAIRQQLIDEIKQAKFNTDSKPVEPVIQQIDDIKKPFEKKVEPTENTDETEIDSGESIQDKFKELDETPDEPKKPVEEPDKKSEVTVEEQSKSNMKKSVIQDFLSSILKNKDKAKENQEPKQPEPVEDIDNKDKTLESEDKQIDDDLSSEENKDINTEIDNSNIEDLSDTDTEETDMRVVKDIVKHEAFGVQIDFDIPDFIKVSDAPDIVEEFEEMQYDIRRGLSSESENNKLFFADFSGSRESFKDNIICVYDTVFKRPTYDSVSVLTILYLMHSGLMGLNPDSTENDILDKIQDQDWIDELCSMYIYLVDIFFVTEKYEIREEAN